MNYLEIVGADAYGAYEFDDLEPCRSRRRVKCSIATEWNKTQILKVYRIVAAVAYKPCVRCDDYSHACATRVNSSELQCLQGSCVGMQLAARQLKYRSNSANSVHGALPQRGHLRHQLLRLRREVTKAQEQNKNLAKGAVVAMISALHQGQCLWVVLFLY